MLILLEIARVYFIMPFKGSQQIDSIDLAYWLNSAVAILRFVLVPLALVLTFVLFKKLSRLQKGLIFLEIGIYISIFYLFNFKFQADKMFFQPTVTQYAQSNNNKIKTNKLVIGIVVNGVAKAYPIQIIGYHHQVKDQIKGKDILVTYCTVCRTGRVFEPKVKGKIEKFRLVGMDHFNAMFEDETTKSWWRQANGEAIIGPLKGELLPEIPSRQMTLASWLELYPNSLILQADTTFKKDYQDLEKYDLGTIKSSLEKRDSLSWKPKSFVIGITHQGISKAYDWNELVSKKYIEDVLNQQALLITIEKDQSSFHSFSRNLNGIVYQFKLTAKEDQLIDSNTGSFWTFKGKCIAGKMQGRQLNPIQSYQEFWHSWKTFHPKTTTYHP